MRLIDGLLKILLGLVAASLPLGGTLLFFAIDEGKGLPENFGVGVLVWLCAYFLFSLPYRASRRRCKSLSEKFAKVYNKGLNAETTRWVDLPVMPLATPYDAETTVTSASIPASDVDAFLDAFVAEFYETTGGDVALTRGDNHRAATGKTRVVLAVKATTKKGELAIVALTIRPVGRVANVSVRWSCWPKSIWPGKGAGLWSVVESQIYDDSWRETMELRYFRPSSWEIGEIKSSGLKKIVAEFADETKAEAQDLALTANMVLSQMTRTGASGL